MCSVPTEVPAGGRARWLHELSVALNGARDVLQRLQLTDCQRVEASELFLRIEAARLEGESLRLSRSVTPREEIHPDWTGFDPWLIPRWNAG